MIVRASFLYLLASFSSGSPVIQPTKHNGTITPQESLQLGKPPPNPFIFRHDKLREVVIKRESASHQIAGVGVSIHNWQIAMKHANHQVLALEYLAQVTGDFRVPRNRFLFEEALDRVTPTHKEAPRGIRIAIQGVSPTVGLMLDDLDVIMLGLSNYGILWETNPSSRQVIMCQVSMYRLGERRSFVAKGSVSLISLPLGNKNLAAS